MKHITKKEAKAIAKKYGIDVQDIIDTVNDMESDGIRVEAEDIIDMIENGDF